MMENFRSRADRRGRPVMIEAWLSATAAPRDTAAQARVAGHLAGFHAGHLIPARFGGPGDRRNLVPMPARINTSYVKAIENSLARHLASGPVFVRITVDYVGEAVVPSHITYALFRRSADGALLPLDGGSIVQAVGSEPSVPMGSIRDPYTGRIIPAREWLDVTSTRGLGPEGSH